MTTEVKDEKLDAQGAALDQTGKAAAEVANLDQQFDGGIDTDEKTLADINTSDTAIEAAAEAIVPKLSEDVTASKVESVHEEANISPLHDAAEELGGSSTGNTISSKNLGTETGKFNEPEENDKVVSYGSANSAVLELQHGLGGEKKYSGKVLGRLERTVNALRRFILAGHTVKEPVSIVEEAGHIEAIAAKAPIAELPTNIAPTVTQQKIAA